jgi:epoxide hydrolase 4
METLVDDVAGLVGALGEPRCALVGHDWGGAIAWQAAARHPELVDRLAILNAPHPAQMRIHLTTNIRQILRSWYIVFFQLPVLPELVLRLGDCRPLVERAIRRTMARPDRFGPEEVERYREAICRPGALEAALAYYREAFRAMLRRGRGMRGARVAVPTLVIWGERDHALGRELNDGLERWAPDLRVELLPAASHWVQQDEPETVNRLLMEFLS